MSRSRRSSNKNRNNNGNGGNNNGGGGGNRSSNNGNGNGNNSNHGSRDDGRDFWGAVLPAVDDEPEVIESPDPTAMVRSLGMPPLAGNRPISEPYFAAVYGKAAGLAHALLAAERPAADAVSD